MIFAVADYEEKELGLGLRFLLEIRNSVERIVAYPAAWNLLSANACRCRIKVFPSSLSSNFTIHPSARLCGKELSMPYQSQVEFTA